jgi:hypothetical protein
VNATNISSSDGAFRAQERRVVLLLCCLAAIHVFIFSAAFPFFSVVDEDAHFDLVVKFSHHEIPKGMETISMESARYIATYGTWEYLLPPDKFPDGKFPPPKWTQPTNAESEKLLGYEIRALMGTNPESTQPPLYYNLAGIWWKAGQAIGLHGGHLLQWIRFLNIILIAVTVWLGNIAARTIFPTNHFVRLGVPALVAFIPQTAFYSIENDSLTPLCFGGAFILLVRWLRADLPNARLGIATGLMLAATYLTKLSSLPLLAVSGMFVLIKIRRSWTEGKLRVSFPALASLVLAAGIPVSIWRAWSKFNFGDATGSAMKIKLLGWTNKPFAERWDHPIFTLHGLWTFCSKLIATFWQGEMLWHHQPLASPVIDTFYTVLTISIAAIVLIALLRRTSFAPGPQCQAVWMSFWCCLSAAAFLGLLSIMYDFHNCFYPSREHPYFSSGRLMLGALIPFSLLFIYGIDYALSRMKNDWVRSLVLGGLILFMLISETVVNRPVFFSEYNWFHM